MNNLARNIIIWLIFGAALIGLFNLFQSPSSGQPANQLAYSDFVAEVEAQQIDEVLIEGRNLRGESKNGRVITSVMPEGANIVAVLDANDVRIVASPENSGMPSFFSILLSWFPMLLFIGIWIFFMRQMQGGSRGAMGFGKSRAKLLTEHQGRVTFEDVAGIDEAKTELEEVVEFLKDPGKFQRLGGKIPKGVLLVGPPGTGKTLLARAIAGEANVPFFTISGSDFVEMFVGVGASRVRDMFEQGKKNAPCIIFIDEIDAVGRHRGAGLGGGNDEREQTLNQMLVEMDGFEANEGVILIAATNRPDVLDPALLRPGRFDRQVVVPNPDVMGREKILKVHMRKTPLAEGVEPRVIARGTPGFSGADLANLVNEAALLAARKGRRTVSMAEFEEAKDKVMLGSERRSMVMTDEEKRLTAYHEAGHAVVALHCPASDPIHKATIIPRGRALGMVMRLPEGDRISLARDKIYADLRVACGGRIAEDLIFGVDKVTTGASSDIRMATDMARRMVTEWGMSDKLGFLAYSADEQEVFLGRSVSQQKNMADATASIIDAEVRRIVDEAYDAATKILKKYNVELERLAQGLLEYETLDGEEIKIIVEGGTLVRKDADDTPVKPGPVRKSRTGLPGTGRPKKPGGEPA
ncbi:MAG: ATP-dependent zinc metalloprotease FtsH [Candidatus Puniceispirillum sp.]|nr:ATP-dependent zinc metalloprotease FtsH [Candidatus Puniceispirillum sp.]MCH1427077.1 ATP-dependent zinc metalloprotease FtsH [Alphaproteobacteria bacterium]